MPKRKRDGATYSPDSPTRSRMLAHVPQPEGVEGKLHHVKKLLHRALKLARGFERQKLGRRRKVAVTKRDKLNTDRLDAEIQALKALDLPATADAHLWQKILKDKQMSVAPALSQYVTSTKKVAQDFATANVVARLYNSNPVKEVMNDALRLIRLSLGIQAQPVGFPADKQNMPRSIKEDEKEAPVLLNSTPGLKSDDKVCLSEIESNSTNAQDIVKSIGALDEDDIDFDMYNNRVGFSSDDELPGRAEIKHSLAYGPVRDLSLSPSPSISASSLPATNILNVKSMIPETTRATFLPSLTMSGYWSGSESEPEDNLPDMAQRKNRRGQRARQQIWEKKYGGRARHVQNPKITVNSRDQGWDMRRGAQESGRGNRYRRGQQWNHISPNIGHKSGPASGGNATELVRPDRRMEKEPLSLKPLHPSWEAAKKVKEQKQTMPFAGKKVVFE